MTKTTANYRMFAANSFQKKIFNLTSTNFEETALELFRYQATANPVYSQYLQNLSIDIESIMTIEAIPFLPIELFKKHTIVSGEGEVQQTFSSSGTTGTKTSRHHLLDLSLYEESFFKGFEHFYGNPQKYCFLALLPAYLERQGSSLVYMAHHLIKRSTHPKSGFYLYNYGALADTIHQLEQDEQATILLGVSFALWDLAEQYPIPLKHTTIMETGGMKGKRKEVIREELHGIYKAAFGVENIHSEYGMTELLSQAYSKGNGIFRCPPWMRVLAREVTDPFNIVSPNRTGVLNIIDLANVHSCAFLATSDLGKCFEDGSFEVLGRMDESDVRGCNLLV